MIGPRFNWRLPEPLPDPPSFDGFTAPVATLLARRGFSDQAGVDRFIGEDTAGLHPLTAMADAARALDRLEDALGRRERIAIWGDYDADGMTAVAVWLLALRELGAEPMRYLPSRLAEGYGLSRAGLEALRVASAGLVVTCDCGVANVEEIAYAREIGLDVIVTDHHLPGARLPDAVAVVDPHRADCGYPEKDLTGAGIAFKLASALLASHGRAVPELAALSAIGTVADMAPILGENRAIVRLGLDALAHTPRAGLRALVARAATQPNRPTVRDLAYGIAPRLNAAGRIAEAELAIALLLAEDRDEAEGLADELEAVNRRRQALTREAVDHALALIAGDADGDSPLVVRHDDWAPGIVGLVAGRLCDLLGRPVAAVTSIGEEVRGSVRAPSDFHVAQALAACAAHLTKLGGHPAAGGFSATQAGFDVFAEAFRAFPRPFPADLAPPEPVERAALDVDLVLPSRYLGWSLCEEVERLAPFGTGCPEPLMAITGLVVADVRRVGSDEGHVVLRMLRGAESFDAIAFDTPPDRELPSRGMRLDLVATLETDRWLGEPRMRLRVRDYAETDASPIAERRRVPASAAR